MRAQDAARQPGRADAGDSTGSADSITPSSSARNPLAKWERVLQALLDRPSLHRFDAERDPRVRDHTLPTTISQLQRRGLRIDRRLIEVPGFAGSVAHVADYSLPADQHAQARALLLKASA